ncbi:hypothetical protein FN846DRAFT_971410 [Sphaerosporella brunnea]|uniref:Uncharacterized protein n=1 Tax=Sphaerosporella brunnea TaxID=1250544 RepID=A0A5J5EH91_9PEZI|nr:hypothetical protein FN846DRAFT_971410 [Sphaerosporella brunnea]
MSGSCHFLIEAGRCLIPCNCTAGIYDVPNRGLQGTTLMCTNCTHPVDYHGNIPGEQPLECQTTVQIDQVPRVPQSTADPYESPRVETVSKLWDQLCKARVVHVRGTPTTGKSTLALLLKSYVVNNFPHIKVFCVSWPASLTPETSYQAPLNRLIGRSPYDEILNDSDMVFIIDEAQNSYAFESLWNDFIKLQASNRHDIAL